MVASTPRRVDDLPGHAGVRTNSQPFMTRPIVFIASSTEGLPEAQAVQSGLQHVLGAAADIRLWTTEFGLSSTYIEALEAVAAAADFAIGVISGDDRVVSRATGRARPQRAPRDNVIFELGLFIGALGRPRCFMVHRKGQDLKLPSDLLAVVSADYEPREDQTLVQALQPRCAQIAKRVLELGALRRISPAALVRRAQSLHMATLLAGDWWQRIRGPGQSAISFLRLDYDAATESLQLRGQAYDLSGQTAAHWHGQVIELHADARRLVYRWSGTHPDTPQTQFHGIGELAFEATADSAPGQPAQPAQRGWGRFWDVDEARPENTQSKAVELRRETDASVVARMRDGRASERAALSVQIHSDW